MTDNNHPIAPPPELFKQWEDDILNERDNVDHVLDRAWRDGFRAGADQELEACCEWVSQFDYDDYSYGGRLRVARRGCLYPPSLKEQALRLIDSNSPYLDDAAIDTIRRALESLPD